jgi:hypothetical protein
LAFFVAILEILATAQPDFFIAIFRQIGNQLIKMRSRSQQDTAFFLVSARSPGLQSQRERADTFLVDLI